MSSPPDLPLPAQRGEGRWPPLEPEFVIARGEVGAELARLLLAAPERLAKLRGLVSGDLLALTGPDLPWVDGVEYFGRDGDSSWLLVPTHQVLEAPASWLERRYRAAFPNLDWPCLLVHNALVPVGRAAALHPPLLDEWLTLTPTLSHGLAQAALRPAPSVVARQARREREEGRERETNE